MANVCTLAAAVLLCAAQGSAQWATCTGTTSQTCTTANVGIGTTSPGGPFRVTAGNLDAFFSSKGGFTSGYSRLFINNDAGRGPTLLSYGSLFPGTSTFNGLPYADLNMLFGYSTTGFVISTNNFVPLVFGTGSLERMRIDSSGNVGIGTTTPTQALDVHGNINVTGNINAKYQDVAEWVDSGEELAPGTVVVLDRRHNNQVEASSTAYDTTVAGVVSSQPGIILGEAGVAKSRVATTGRVRVKVDASRSPIAVGDLLVTSDRTGLAMKSKPLDLGGIAIHRPGTIIGKALEPLSEGIGEVLVLLSLQ